VTGATGYLGSRLCQALLERGHDVRVLVRASSRARAPAGASVTIGEALDFNAYVRSLDLPAARVAAEAARWLRLPHFVYVSVAQPAPVMKAYLEARGEAEAHLERLDVPSTILRPWYVLGPGHWWPLLLVPLYAVASLIPGLRGGARRLGLVSLKQMLDALVTAVEHPVAQGQKIIDVPQIRNARLEARALPL
jgi:uncharacterized protein YbjT (DUF2867 family)